MAKIKRKTLEQSQKNSLVNGYLCLTSFFDARHLDGYVIIREDLIKRIITIIIKGLEGS